MTHADEIRAALAAARVRTFRASEELDRHGDCARTFHHCQEKLERDLRLAEADCEILERELARAEPL